MGKIQYSALQLVDQIQIFLWITIVVACQPVVREPEMEDLSYILDRNQLPTHEIDLDHAGLISAWSEDTYAEGEKIYRTQCFQCHGDEHQPGSLPMARKFWKDTLKSRSDPYIMYQIVTRGHGQMPPQTTLVPRQKYDVIHFIRERFIRPLKPDHYFEIGDNWLADLPPGNQQGPDPKPYHPWKDMDYGNWFIHCYEVAGQDAPPKHISGGRAPLPNEDYSEVNFAYKGIAIRLDAGTGGIARGNHFALFDHDLLRFAGAWSGHEFIDWEDILLDDQHNVYPRTKGKLQTVNPVTPGWANPETGQFTDPRIRGKDGRPFGPLPREWAHYKGFYPYGNGIIIKYSVDQAIVHEYYEMDSSFSEPIFIRTLHISENPRALKMRILPSRFPVKISSKNAFLSEEEGFHILNIPEGEICNVIIAFVGTGFDLDMPGEHSKIHDLTTLIKNPESTSPQIIHSSIIPLKGSSSFDVDIFSLPSQNLWNSRLRPTGIDFLDEGKTAVVCTIDGEVWKVSDLSTRSGQVQWSRIATGLFQPLGIKYHRNQIYVGCRDQIVRLHDVNGDETIDFYESFNSDHQVTEHFHEFAMGLQVDEAGNFYYAKSGRHARTSLVPQHGTLIKVSPDGKISSIIADGFRAANGVCINPDGSFFVTDQEGYWNPMNRINRVIPGGFYGNMWGYGAPADSSDSAMEMPLCWIDMKYDRSPAELLWIDSDKWGPLKGGLLSLSYGDGKIFLVLPQKIQETYQGGIVELPLPQFPTGLIRGRFNQADGQLYVCGMSAWATNQMLQTGGLYRINYRENKDLHIPLHMEFNNEELRLDFSAALDEKTVLDPGNYQFNTWQLKRSRKYGSDRHDEKQLPVKRVVLGPDKKTITLEIPNLEPTWIYELLFEIKSARQQEIKGAIQGTIYRTNPPQI